MPNDVRAFGFNNHLVIEMTQMQEDLERYRAQGTNESLTVENQDLKNLIEQLKSTLSEERERHQHELS
jgi:cell division protein FtsB